MKQFIQIISAPSILGLRPSGVELLPESLLRAGLISKIGTMNTIVDVPTLNAEYSGERDPETKCLNAAAVRDFSISLMSEIEEQIDNAAWPLVLGGDCSILIGIMPALKTKGNFGLVFLDAHADFYQPAASTTGELADMDLAIVTGRGPAIISDINQLTPYVEDRHVIHIGQRDAEEAKKFGSRDIADSDIKQFDLATIRLSGWENVVQNAIDYIQTLNIDGFWIHFDTDVISDEENPAVEYRLPGGLSFEEAGYILNRLLRTGKAIGMSITIYNPNLDTTGEIAVKITDCLEYAFQTR